MAAELGAQGTDGAPPYETGAGADGEPAATVLQEPERPGDHSVSLFYMVGVLPPFRVVELDIGIGHHSTNLAHNPMADMVRSADRITYSRDCLDIGGTFRRLI